MRLTDNDFPDAPRPSGTLLDARLHLLDRQLLDAAGEPVGIVDDLEIDGVRIGAGTVDPAPRVSAILTGQVLATRIFGGTPPRVRLQPLEWVTVHQVGTVIQLSTDASQLDSLWVERWLRDHIIARIPGGRRAAQ
jgi:hypothetical protein